MELSQWKTIQAQFNEIRKCILQTKSKSLVPISARIKLLYEYMLYCSFNLEEANKYFDEWIKDDNGSEVYKNHASANVLSFYIFGRVCLVITSVINNLVMKICKDTAAKGKLNEHRNQFTKTVKIFINKRDLAVAHPTSLTYVVEPSGFGNVMGNEISFLQWDLSHPKQDPKEITLKFNQDFQRLIEYLEPLPELYRECLEIK